MHHVLLVVPAGERLTIAGLRRGTPSASSARMSGATRSIMAFSSAVPVEDGGLVRGMRVRWEGSIPVEVGALGRGREGRRRRTPWLRRR